MATPHLSVRMTPEMYEKTKRLAQDCRIVHAEWIRRCMYWGLMNPSQIQEIALPEPYDLIPPGRPSEEM